MRNFLLLITIAAALTISVSGQTVPTKKAVKVLVYDSEQIFGDNGVPQLLELRATAERVCRRSRERRLEIESELNRRWAQLLDYSASSDQLIERKRRFERLSSEIDNVQLACTDAIEGVNELEKKIRAFINQIKKDNNALVATYGNLISYPAHVRYGPGIYYCDPVLDRTGQLKLAILSFLSPGGKPDVVPQLPELLPRVIDDRNMFSSPNAAAYQAGIREYYKRISDLVRGQVRKDSTLPPNGELRNLIFKNRDRLMSGLPQEFMEFDGIIEDFARTFGYDFVISSNAFFVRSIPDREDVTERFRDYFVLRRSANQAMLPDRITIPPNPSIIPK